MKDLSIEEKNEVIAVFDGLIKQPKGVNYNLDSWYKPDPDDKRKKGQWVAYTHQLKYHSSWDWLHTVIDKIDREYAPIIKMPDDLQCLKDGDHSEFFDCTAMPISSPISEVYENVFKFVNWYNNQKP